MNIAQAQGHEALFGPQSALINVSDFIQSACSVEEGLDNQPSCRVFSTSAKSLGILQEEWLPAAQRGVIETECRVDDLQRSLNDVITDPRLMSNVTKTHQATVFTIHDTADTSTRRKRKRITVTEPADEHPSVTQLRTKLGGVQLTCWPLLMNSALFIRSPKQSDHNTLVATKRLAIPSTSSDPRQVLIFVTIYTPLTWGHRLLSRSSQHVLLSSHTVGDLFDIIPCTSNEMPEVHESEDDITTWNETSPEVSTGAVICMDDILYGDGLSEEDYSKKLLDHIQTTPEHKRPKLTKGAPMHDTTFASLSLRLHHPYWLLHCGDCEHFFVIEQIRLLHPSDPPLPSYPLTTQITPPLLDVCRACNKVPAVYSIVGDMRLGESPFLICAPCWRWMGMPKGEEAKKVTVVPLPKYEFGWGG